MTLKYTMLSRQVFIFSFLCVKYTYLALNIHFNVGVFFFISQYFKSLELSPFSSLKASLLTSFNNTCRRAGFLSQAYPHLIVTLEACEWQIRRHLFACLSPIVQWILTIIFCKQYIFAECTQCMVFAFHYGITEVMFKLLFNVSSIVWLFLGLFESSLRV